MRLVSKNGYLLVIVVFLSIGSMPTESSPSVTDWGQQVTIMPKKGGVNAYYAWYV